MTAQSLYSMSNFESRGLSPRMVTRAEFGRLLPELVAAKAAEELPRALAEFPIRA